MHTSSMFPAGAAHTLIDILRLRAADQATETAYTFIDDDHADGQPLSYADLDRQARSIAAQLQALDSCGQRALLLYPPGADYIAAFYGCLYAGVVAVPAYPPAANRPAPRIQAIVADSQATLVLTTPHILSTLDHRLRQTPDLEHVRWLALDAGLSGAAEQWSEPTLDSQSLAFLQYTSGSTATPKGVMLSHGNLLHNLTHIVRKFQLTPRSHGVIWLPPYHDMGLIGGILAPLGCGFPVTLMSPLAFLKRPLLWLQTIARVGGTCSGGPNFAYDLCVRKISAEERAGLDLSSWDVAFCGAEPIRPETIARFVTAFEPYGFRAEAFYPCYGLAEATLIVSGGLASSPPVTRRFRSEALEQHRAVPATDDEHASRALVGCGTMLTDQQLAIVDPGTLRRCPDGEIGEVWVCGPSVAQGYWRRPEETRATFAAQLADPAEGPFLRTGDLGFIHQGELFITGRLKDLIIIRGRNYYPHDIELTVEQSHPALRPGGGAVFALDDPVAPQEALVVVQEVERHYRRWDSAAIIDAIRQAVTEQHQLRVHAVVLIKPGTLPKTSSGKVQRYACRAQFLADQLALIAASVLDAPAAVAGSQTQTRATIAALPPDRRYSALLGYLQSLIASSAGHPVAMLDPDRPLNALGLDSLAVVEVQHTLEATLGINLSPATLLSDTSLADLTAVILERLLDQPEHEQPSSSAAHSRAQLAPLTHGQQALWFFHALAPDSTQYHIARAVRIDGQLDVAALRAAFQALVDRHSALRTTFPIRDGAPMQQIHDQLAVSFEIEDAAADDRTQLQQRLDSEASRPFDLAHGPLLRVTLFSRSAREHVALLAIHHIVADFWSLAILVDELRQLYAARRVDTVTLPPVRDYVEYLTWQQTLLAGPDGERQWRYWQQQLSPADGRALPVLDLPTDRPRAMTPGYRGAAHRFAVPAELTQALTRLAAEQRATLYTLLLAAFAVLLLRHTGQDDLMIGVPLAARSRQWLSSIVGYVVNTLPLRLDLADDPPFTALVQQVRARLVAALEHQDIPFALLVERLQPERQPNRSPLFQTLFVLQKAHLLHDDGLTGFAVDAPGQRIGLADLTVELLPLEQQASQLDITMSMAELNGQLVGTLAYDRALFDAATIESLAARYVQLLSSIVAAPQGVLSRLPLLLPDDEQRLSAWNATAADYPADRTLPDLIAATAARTPDAVAVSYQDQRLRYAELERRAHQLAHHLQQLGVGRQPHAETPVAICLTRSLDLPVALLGVLYAGGAYLPLDPSYPPDRLQLMLSDAGSRVLLTTQPVARALIERGLPLDMADPSEQRALDVVYLDADWPTIAAQPTSRPPRRLEPDSPAYVIYTSGSTGQPKGVVVPQRAVVNFLTTMRRTPGLRPNDRLLAVTTLSFDIAVLELLLPLTTGAQTIIAPREAVADGTRLAALLAQSGATVMQATPATWRLLLETGWTGDPNLTILCGGEALPPDLAAQLRSRCRALWNLYGPTETTVWSTAAEVPAEPCTVTIGRPIANTQVYILDRYGQRVPVGVAGELYIGGAGVARGYLNRPALTAEKFVPNPFAEEGEQSGENQEARTQNQGNPEPGEHGNTEQVLASRLYRTGDWARWRADGALEYLGRQDQQVKLRGYRIELGEIAAALRAHPAVQDAVVVVAPDERLVAYVVGVERVPAGQTENREQRTENREQRTENKGTGRPLGEQGNSGAKGHEVDPSSFRAFLATRLPDYMLPSVFVALPALPRTPNGKLDRKALPAPDAVHAEPGTPFVAPRTPVEEAIAAVWAELLGLERVGVDDNFFALGGHSLLATRLTLRLRETLGLNIPIQLIFERPTIAGLAAHLPSLQPDTSSAQPIVRRARTPYQP